MTVAIETGLDDELLLEGRVYDLIRTVNAMRKDEGFEVTDRIVLTVPQELSELVAQHADWIKREVLAVEIRVGSELAVEKR